MRLAAEVAIPKMANLRDTQGALKRLLVLDGIQDPGNLGTLIRTALALGWQGVYLLPGNINNLTTPGNRHKPDLKRSILLTWSV